jgi:dolichyl-phosphate beta-glucosyltransferase
LGAEAQNARLSVVIPCYNERQRLPPTLASVQDYLSRTRQDSEIIVVDDGSRDGTAAWVREQAAADPRVRLISYSPNGGKGHAVKQGMLAATGRYVLFMDADGSTGIGEVAAMVPLIESGQADVVIGSRKDLGAQIGASQNLPRLVAGVVFSYLIGGLVFRGLKDCQCGFKVFSDKASRDVFSRLTLSSALFDVEILLLATLLGYRIAALPVAWEHDRDSRLTYNLTKSVRIFLDLLRIKFRYRVWWPVRVNRPPARARRTA